MTILLTIDTSIRGVSACLSDPTDPHHLPLWESAHLDVMSSASQIATLVERGLEHIRQPATVVEGITVSVGPGSFTGIKIGIAFAAGFTLGRRNECRLLGGSSLEQALAAMRRDNDEWRGVFLPATRTHGFVSHGGDGGVETRLVDLTADSRDQAWLADLQGKYAVIGEWPALESSPHWRGEKLAHSEGAEYALRGLRHLATASWPDNFSENVPSPQYMRLTTAEEKLEQQATKE